MLPPSVVDYLQAHRDEHLESLFELLRFASTAHATGPEAHQQCLACAEWLAAYLRKIGLEAAVVATANRPNVLARAHVSDKVPTLLIYGHYDVQPPDPIDQWRSPPFEPVVRDGWIYARGAHDDKGQLFTHLMAVEAWQRAGGHLPVNVKILLEGEEEIGSPDLEQFVAGRVDELAADAAVISDSAFFADGMPSITYALRGLVYVELSIKGQACDVHSGSHGGALANPINALAGIIAQMHDERGRVTLPGFYDDVASIDEAERGEWTQLGFDEKDFADSLSVPCLAGGEKGYSVLERLWARPTLDCNGIVGGYTGAGAKTVLPAEARSKISMRLVPHQEPQRIAEAFKQFVTEHTPAGMSAEVNVSSAARPVLLERNSPAMEAASAAYEEGFGKKAVYVRSGASVPVTDLIQRYCRIDPVMMGFGLPADDQHAPNEKFRLDQLWRGSVTSAAFMHNLARMTPKAAK